MVTTRYDWLPEVHLGVAATLSHADELIGQVSDLLFDYQRQPDGVIGLREVRVGSVSRTVVERIVPMPRKVPLLVADALVALRAALEHLLFAEVEFREGSALDEKAARRIEMPASETYDKFREWVAGRARNGPPSLQAGSELVRRIEGLQPFVRTIAPEDHPLARLVRHTNHAKHRTPVIMGVRLGAMYEDARLPRSMSELQRGPDEPLRVGDVLAETPIGRTIPITLFPTIEINRPGSDRWTVLMQELDEIALWVRTQAVPRLITGADPSRLALPARYDISIGHDDERQAISTGSMVTAAARHKDRLGAASARLSLVETISLMNGAPSPEQLEQWLAHLSDKDVLDRVSRLTLVRAGDADSARRNIEVMTALCNEALAISDS